MDSHPEERRIAGLLRELIVQSGTTLAVLEERLGWEAGRLTALLDGDQRLSFDDVSEILPLLGLIPTDFFAWLYGFDFTEAGRPEAPPPSARGSSKERAMQRLFERSLRAVRNAIARRAAWKRQRTGED